MRAAVVRIVDHGASTTLIGPRGALRFDGDSAALVRAVLEIHLRPVTRDQLFEQLAVLSGGEVPASPVDELVAILEREGVLVAPQAPSPRSFAVQRRVVLGVSGAVAAYGAPQLVRGLHALECDVRVAMTKTAQRFVAVATLEALTHEMVWRGIWQRDRLPVPHINLAEWAELVVVWPASATTLSRIASGDCSDLVSAIATATRAPVVLAPSMNSAMFDSAPVQATLETLRTHGRWIVHPTLGYEVAHPPVERHPIFGSAAPVPAMLDIVRHILTEVVPRARLPETAGDWERLWSTTGVEQLPWHTGSIDDVLAQTLGKHTGTLLDLGTGTGVVAIEAARRDFRVTATDIAPTALGRARERAGELPILFALDDVTASHLAGSFDVVVDVGLLHCLPRENRPLYASTVTERTACGGTLLVIAHQPGTTDVATHPITADEIRALLPAFELVNVTATTLSRSDARLFELRRSR